MRKVALFFAMAGLAAALGGAAPAVSAELTSVLPACPAAAASTRAPTGPAGPGTPGACRATGRVLESGVRIARRGEVGFTPSGYHHLGANTGGEWSGVSGRISVVGTTIRPGTYDFVAGRFMVKRNLGRGNIAWLEAGWAQTGWAAPGRPHVYTFNTNTKTWQFYDQYTLKPGDKAWLDLHSDTDGWWGAWLWWGNRWNLLTVQKLPIGSTATVEQYVEVHVDAGKPGRVDVPAVTVDNVQLRPAGGGSPRFWRDDVPTLTGADSSRQQRRGGFCLDWVTRYDTWRAGDCTDSARLPTSDEVKASGEAEVVQPTAKPSVPGTPSSAPASPATPPAEPTPAAAVPSLVETATPAVTETVEPPTPAVTRRPGLLGGLLGG